MFVLKIDGIVDNNNQEVLKQIASQLLTLNYALISCQNTVPSLHSRPSFGFERFPSSLKKLSCVNWWLARSYMTFVTNVKKECTWRKNARS